MNEVTSFITADSLALLIAATLNAGTVVALAALGLLLNERAGVLNLGAEGMMLVAAIAGFATGVATGNDWLAFGAGALAGAVMAGVFGLLVIWLNTNQYATGLALSLFGVGLSAFLGISYTQQRLPERHVLDGGFQEHVLDGEPRHRGHHEKAATLIVGHVPPRRLRRRPRLLLPRLVRRHPLPHPPHLSNPPGRPGPAAVAAAVVNVASQQSSKTADAKTDKAKWKLKVACKTIAGACGAAMSSLGMVW